MTPILFYQSQTNTKILQLIGNNFTIFNSTSLSNENFENRIKLYKNGQWTRSD